MKTPFPVLLVALAAACSRAAPPPSVSAPSDPTDAEVALRAWYRHLDNGHLDSLATVTTPDFIAIDGADTVTVAQAVAHFQDNGVRRTRTTSLEFHRRAVSGDLAVAIATWTGTVELKDITVPERERLTVTSRREGGIWRIAAIHLAILDQQERGP